MIDYIKCSILFLATIIFFMGIGLSVDKNRDKEISYKFILGYIVYTFFAAIPGMIVQILGLPWLFYCVYLVFLWIGFIIFVLCRYKTNKLQKISLADYVKDNYFLFIVTFIVLCISFLYVWLFWANNHSDDGYYIGKIAEYPYMDNPFRTNVVNGFSEYKLDSYIINTWELQSSVVSYLTGINPVLYVRLYLNAFNIFLLVNVISSLAIRINSTTQLVENNKFKKVSQYASSIIIFFSFNSSFLEQNGLIQLTDLWQFNSGIYLGSSIVRVIGLPLLMLFFLEVEKIRLKHIIVAVMISVVLMSKSTIALPLLVIFCLTFFFIYFAQKGKDWLIKSIIISLFVIAISALLRNNVQIETMLYGFLINNLHSWIIIAFIVIYLLIMLCKNKYIFKVNGFILIMFILMFLNPLNNIFELSSVYDFVGGRAHTSFVYLFLIIGYIYILLLFFRFLRQKIFFSIVAVCTTTLSVLSFYSFKITGNIMDSYKTIYTNKDIIPKSTELLSKELDKLSEDKEITVICPTLPIVNGRAHTLSVCLKFWAPEIKNVSSLIRFSNTNAIQFSSYNDELQEKFNEFSAKPNQDNSECLDELINDYPINTIIVESLDAQEYLSMYNFELKSSINDEINGKSYYIFTKLI